VRAARGILPSAALAGALLLAMGNPAAAHLVTTGLGPFYDGMLHQAGSMPDMLAVAALALLAGNSGARQARLVALAVPLTWLAAGLTGLLVPVHLDTRWPEIAALIGLGGTLAAGYVVPASVAAALAVAVALLSGVPNNPPAEAAGFSVTGLAGGALVLFVFSTLVAALAFSLKPAWTRVAVRVAGSWIAAIGLLLLGWTLRGGDVGAA
jgi:urease accessory protein